MGSSRRRLPVLIVLLVLVTAFPASVVVWSVPGDLIVSPPANCGIVIQPCFSPTYTFGVNGTATFGNNYADKVTLQAAIAGYTPTLSSNATAYWYTGNVGSCVITVYYSHITSTSVQHDIKWSGCPAGSWTFNLKRASGSFTVLSGCILKSSTIQYDFCRLKVSGGSLTWTGTALRVTVTSSSGYIDPAQIVQSASCTASAVSTFTCAYSNPVTVRDILIVAVSADASQTSVTVTDTAIGQTYQQPLTCIATNTGSSDVLYTVVEASASAFSVTITGSASANWIANILEVNGLTVSGYACATATGTSTAPALAKNQLNAGTGAVFSLVNVYANNPGGTPYTAGSTYTLLSTSSVGAAEWSISGTANTGPMTLGSSVAWAESYFILTGYKTKQTTATAASATSVAATPADEVAGNEVVVVCASTVNANAATATISDTLSQSWTLDGTASNTAAVRCWHTLSTSSGADTITVTNAASSTQWGLVVMIALGYTPASPQTGTNTGTGTSYSVGSMSYSTTTVDLAMVSAAGNLGTATAGSGWSLLSGAGNAALVEIAAHSSPVTCDATGTTSQNWAEVCVIFNELTVFQLFVEPGINTNLLSATNKFTFTRVAYGAAADSPYIIGVGSNYIFLTFVADPATNVVIAATSASSTSTRQWAITYSGGVATTTSLAVGNTATTSKLVDYFEAFKHTFQITPSTPSTWDASRSINIDCLQAGVLGTCITFTPANGDGSKTSSVFTDNSQIAVCEASTGGVSGQSWVPSTQQTASLGTPGGDTVTCSYTLLTDHFTTTTTSSTTTTTSTTSTQTNNLADPPNYLWLLLVPIALIVLVAAKKRL